MGGRETILPAGLGFVGVNEVGMHSVRERHGAFGHCEGGAGSTSCKLWAGYRVFLEKWWEGMAGGGGFILAFAAGTSSVLLVRE